MPLQYEETRRRGTEPALWSHYKRMGDQRDAISTEFTCSPQIGPRGLILSARCGKMRRLEYLDMATGLEDLNPNDTSDYC